MRFLALPPAASICSTNVNTVSPFAGYELFIGNTINPDTCFAHVRVISNFVSNIYLGVIGSKNVCDGAWHYISATYDGSSTPGGVALYVDCVLDPAPTTEKNGLNATIVGGTQTLQVGSQNGNSAFTVRGELGFYSLSNIARSSGYETTNCNATNLPAVDANTVLQYNFQNDTGTTVTDQSASGFNGTLTSTSQWWPQ